MLHREALRGRAARPPPRCRVSRLLLSFLVGPRYLFCNDVSVPFPLEEPELSSSLILGLLFPGVFPKLVSGR